MSKLPQVKIPLNLISETPDKWVVVKITDQGGPGINDPEYKVFATWAGGYTDSDRWKMNSGISKVEEDDEYFYFFGFSGSCYKCHKKGYGYATTFGQLTLTKLVDMGKKHGNIDIEEMSESTDWKLQISGHE